MSAAMPGFLRHWHSETQAFGEKHLAADNHLPTESSVSSLSYNLPFAPVETAGNVVMNRWERFEVDCRPW